MGIHIYIYTEASTYSKYPVYDPGHACHLLINTTGTWHEQYLVLLAFPGSGLFEVCHALGNTLDTSRHNGHSLCAGC